MLKIKTILLGVTFCSWVNLAHAYPHGCEVSGFGYNDNYLILNDTGDQKLYLIQNRSNFKIQLERQNTDDAFMSPTLKAKIDREQWSSFASDVENLYFKCSKMEGDDEATVNCSDVLDICEYPRVKFAPSNMGNYWVSTNKAQGQVIKESADKGILLRW